MNEFTAMQQINDKIIIDNGLIGLRKLFSFMQITSKKCIISLMSINEIENQWWALFQTIAIQPANRSNFYFHYFLNAFFFFFPELFHNMALYRRRFCWWNLFRDFLHLLICTNFDSKLFFSLEQYFWFCVTTMRRFNKSMELWLDLEKKFPF